MKIYFQLRLNLILILILSATFASHGIGIKLIDKYTSAPLSDIIVWDIAEWNGWTFLATDEGLWQNLGFYPDFFQLNNRRAVRSVNIDKQNNRIYVGGINEFGFFSPSSTNSLEYVCLSDSIGDDKYIGNIWGIYPNENIITVQGDNTIITYDLNTNKHNIINTTDKLDGSELIENILMLATDNGLKFLMGKTIASIPNADRLKGKRIREILEYDKGLLIVCSDGVWKYKDQQLNKINLLDKFLGQLGEIFSADLDGSKLALGSVDKGIGIIDLKTNEFNLYNEENGLASNTIISLNFDETGDLWVGMQYGIAKILLTLPVEKLESNYLSIGSGNVMKLKDNKLFLGTNRGLYSMDFNNAGHLLSKTSLQHIEGLRGPVWGLQNIDENLFVAHDKGLFTISSDGTAQKLGNSSGVWDIQKVIGSKDKSYLGTYSGLSILRKKNGKWTEETSIDGYTSSLYNFVQESPCVVWSNNSELGIDRLTIDTIHNRITGIQTFKEAEDGFPLTGEIFLSRIDNDVIFSTSNGIYKYNKDTKKIEKEKEISRLLNEPENVRRIRKTGGSIYALTDNELLKADPAGILDMQRIPVNPNYNRPIHDRELIFSLDNDIISYPVKDGYLFYDFSSNSDNFNLYSPKAIIHRAIVTNTGDSAVYRGNFASLKHEPTLTYKENSIKIEYGNEDEIRKGTLFSIKLNNEPWSIPTTTRSKEYTHLSPGKYKFEVKAVTPDGKEAIDSLIFRITPPWWRSAWMLTIYALLGIFIILSFLWLLQKRISKRESNLIKEKDKEIANQKEKFRIETEEKDRQIEKLERDKIEKEIRHKAQEVANVMLTLSHKNDTLQMVKKGINEIMALLPGGSSEARKALQNLQSKVIVDLRSDDILKRVEEEFDIVHDNYMKKLRTKYPDLTNNELLLCAYLRMDLPTKEIAPLLNISPRGVETMRYRLKKKLELDKEISLVDFLKGDEL